MNDEYMMINDDEEEEMPDDLIKTFLGLFCDNGDEDDLDYSQIEFVHETLEKLEVPHEYFDHALGGKHLAYPNKEKCVCSVVLTPFSYGGSCGRMEIMGLLTPEESEGDDVVGYLDAQDVLSRILGHYLAL